MSSAVAAMGLFLLRQKRRRPIVAVDWFWVGDGWGGCGAESGGKNRLVMVVGRFPAVAGGVGESLLVKSAAVSGSERLNLFVHISTHDLDSLTLGPRVH